MRKEQWQSGLSNAVIDRDPLQGLPDIQSFIPEARSMAEAVSISQQTPPPVHPLIKEAVDSLDEMLEAELSSDMDNNVHSAILAAFESKKEVDTAVSDVSSTCEELKDMWEGELVAMPECTEWPDPMPISRFGEGAMEEDDGSDGVAKPFFRMPSKRMLASSGAIMLFLTAASVAYFDLDIPLGKVGTPSQTASGNLTATKTATAENSDVKPDKTLVASAGNFSISKPAEAELKPAPVVRQAFESPQQTGVTLVEKNYSPPAAIIPEAVASKSVAKSPIENVIARVAAAEKSISPAAAFAANKVDLSERFVGFDRGENKAAFKKSTVELQPEDLSLKPTRVKTVLLARRVPDGAPPQPARRAELTVKQALRNAKAIDTLTASQKEQLLPRLVDGECVAGALGKVAGRVSPVLMRDLLTSLNSDC